MYRTETEGKRRLWSNGYTEFFSLLTLEQRKFFHISYNVIFFSYLREDKQHNPSFGLFLHNEDKLDLIDFLGQV